MKKLLHRIALIGAAAAIVLAGTATAAQADSGWLYTSEANSINRGYFHTNPGGGTAYDEKLTVCDNNGSDVGGTIIMVSWPNQYGYYLTDSSDNGKCLYDRSDMFPDGVYLEVKVCHFHGFYYDYGDALVNCTYGSSWS